MLGNDLNETKSSSDGNYVTLPLPPSRVFFVYSIPGFRRNTHLNWISLISNILELFPWNILQRRDHTVGVAIYQGGGNIPGRRQYTREVAIYQGGGNASPWEAQGGGIALVAPPPFSRYWLFKSQLFLNHWLEWFSVLKWNRRHFGLSG